LAIRTGDPEFARKLNRALILELIRKKDQISRADITKELKLSKVTVSSIVNELIQEKLISEIGEGVSNSRGGRKPILISLNNTHKYVIGVDIGTTNTVLAIGNLKGVLIKIKRIKTVKNRSVNNIVNQVTSHIPKIIEESKVNNDEILALGMSVAGTVIKQKGLISFSPDFNWKNVQISKIFQEIMKLSTVADNCTRVMTLGEIWFGKAKKMKNIFYVNIGYGIGSAMVINGRIYNEHSEFGHSFLTTKKILCSCGNYGCVEALTSGHAIERQANEIFKDKKKEWITAQGVAEMAQNGNEKAIKIYNEIGRYLGRAISVIASTFNPEMIIIGGGVALAGDLLLNPIKKEFNIHVIEDIKRNTKLELSALGLDAAVYGAVALALNEYVFKQEIISY